MVEFRKSGFSCEYYSKQNSIHLLWAECFRHKKLILINKYQFLFLLLKNKIKSILNTWTNTAREKLAVCDVTN